MREQRQVDRADHAELDAYHAAKRITNLKVELDALVKQYALALSFFDRWKKCGVKSVTAIHAELAKIANRVTDAE